jgi:hypothetical protein
VSPGSSYGTSVCEELVGYVMDLYLNNVQVNVIRGTYGMMEVE